MTFLPVVERELRVSARNAKLYWGRCAAAGVALAVGAWLWLTRIAGNNAAANATAIFSTLSTLSFIYCLFLGIFLTADAISEEKREGTLGLLFLTDLRGYDVAFGKLAAHSLRAVYSVIAIFPILTIPLLLGGIEFAEVSRMALVLLDTLGLSLTVGLVVSTWSKNDRKAQLGAFCVIVFITGVLPGILGLLRNRYRLPIPKEAYVFTPAFTFATAYDRGFKGSETLFWLSAAVVHVLSWICFIAAAIAVRTVWQDRPGASERSWRARYRRWQRGSPMRRKRYRETLLGANAYYWLSARDRLKPHYVLWFLCGCGLCWCVLWFYNGKQMFELEAFFACSIILHTALKVWFAAEAGRQFHEDRRSSALELTLSTPLPVREVIEGQFLALFRQFGAAVAILLAFDVAGIIIGARMRFGMDTEWILTWVAMIVIFLVDIATLSAYGMWLGLSKRKSGRAVVQNLFNVLCVPWLVLLGFFTYTAMARVSSADSPNYFIGAYFVVSLLADAVLFLNAAGNLTSRFRDLATQPFQHNG